MTIMVMEQQLCAPGPSKDLTCVEDEDSDVGSCCSSDSSDSKDGPVICQCSICLGNLRTHSRIASPDSCNHRFCEICLVEWAKNINTCPVDRSVFRTIMVRSGDSYEIIRKVDVPHREFLRLSEDEGDDLMNTVCRVCALGDRADRLLLCDRCDDGYHLECLTPALTAVPPDEWFCPSCRSEEQADSGVETSPLRPTERVARTVVHDYVLRRVAQAIGQTSSSEGEDDNMDQDVPSTSRVTVPVVRGANRKRRATTKRRKKTTARRKTTTKRRRKVTKKGGRKRKGFRKGKRTRTLKTVHKRIMKQEPKKPDENQSLSDKVTRGNALPTVKTVNKLRLFEPRDQIIVWDEQQNTKSCDSVSKPKCTGERSTSEDLLSGILNTQSVVLSRSKLTRSVVDREGTLKLPTVPQVISDTMVFSFNSQPTKVSFNSQPTKVVVPDIVPSVVQDDNVKTSEVEVIERSSTTDVGDANKQTAEKPSEQPQSGILDNACLNWQQFARVANANLSDKSIEKPDDSTSPPSLPVSVVSATDDSVRPLFRDSDISPPTHELQTPLQTVNLLSESLPPLIPPRPHVPPAGPRFDSLPQRAPLHRGPPPPRGDLAPFRARPPRNGPFGPPNVMGNRPRFDLACPQQNIEGPRAPFIRGPTTPLFGGPVAGIGGPRTPSIGGPRPDFGGPTAPNFGGPRPGIGGPRASFIGGPTAAGIGGPSGPAIRGPIPGIGGLRAPFIGGPTAGIGGPTAPRFNSPHSTQEPQAAGVSAPKKLSRRSLLDDDHVPSVDHRLPIAESSEPPKRLGRFDSQPIREAQPVVLPSQTNETGVQKRKTRFEKPRSEDEGSLMNRESDRSRVGPVTPAVVKEPMISGDVATSISTGGPTSDIGGSTAPKFDSPHSTQEPQPGVSTPVPKKLSRRSLLDDDPVTPAVVKEPISSTGGPTADIGIGGSTAPTIGDSTAGIGAPTASRFDSPRTTQEAQPGVSAPVPKKLSRRSLLDDDDAPSVGHGLPVPSRSSGGVTASISARKSRAPLLLEDDDSVSPQNNTMQSSAPVTNAPRTSFMSKPSDKPVISNSSDTMIGGSLKSRSSDASMQQDTTKEQNSSSPLPGRSFGLGSFLQAANIGGIQKKVEKQMTPIPQRVDKHVVPVLQRVEKPVVPAPQRAQKSPPLAVKESTGPPTTGKQIRKSKKAGVVGKGLAGFLRRSLGANCAQSSDGSEDEDESRTVEPVVERLQKSQNQAHLHSKSQPVVTPQVRTSQPAPYKPKVAPQTNAPRASFMSKPSAGIPSLLDINSQNLEGATPDPDVRPPVTSSVKKHTPKHVPLSMASRSSPPAGYASKPGIGDPRFLLTQDASFSSPPTTVRAPSPAVPAQRFAARGSAISRVSSYASVPTRVSVTHAPPVPTPVHTPASTSSTWMPPQPVPAPAQTSSSPTVYPPSSVHPPTVYPPNSVHPPTVYPPNSVHPPTVYPPNSVHSPTVYPPNSVHSPTVYPPNSVHPPTMYPPSSVHPPIVYPPTSMQHSAIPVVTGEASDTRSLMQMCFEGGVANETQANAGYAHANASDPYNYPPSYPTQLPPGPVPPPAAPTSAAPQPVPFPGPTPPATSGYVFPSAEQQQTYHGYPQPVSVPYYDYAAQQQAAAYSQQQAAAYSTYSMPYQVGCFYPTVAPVPPLPSDPQPPLPDSEPPKVAEIPQPVPTASAVNVTEISDDVVVKSRPSLAVKAVKLFFKNASKQNEAGATSPVTAVVESDTAASKVSSVSVVSTAAAATVFDKPELTPKVHKKLYKPSEDAEIIAEEKRKKQVIKQLLHLGDANKKISAESKSNVEVEAPAKAKAASTLPDKEKTAEAEKTEEKKPEAATKNDEKPAEEVKQVESASSVDVSKASDRRRSRSRSSRSVSSRSRSSSGSSRSRSRSRGRRTRSRSPRKYDRTERRRRSGSSDRRLSSGSRGRVRQLVDMHKREFAHRTTRLMLPMPKHVKQMMRERDAKRTDFSQRGRRGYDKYGYGGRYDRQRLDSYRTHDRRDDTRRDHGYDYRKRDDQRDYDRRGGRDKSEQEDDEGARGKYHDKSHDESTEATDSTKEVREHPSRESSQSRPSVQITDSSAKRPHSPTPASVQAKGARLSSFVTKTTTLPVTKTTGSSLEPKTTSTFCTLSDLTLSTKVAVGGSINKIVEKTIKKTQTELGLSLQSKLLAVKKGEKQVQTAAIKRSPKSGGRTAAKTRRRSSSGSSSSSSSRSSSASYPVVRSRPKSTVERVVTPVTPKTKTPVFTSEDEESSMSDGSPDDVLVLDKVGSSSAEEGSTQNDKDKDQSTPALETLMSNEDELICLDAWREESNDEEDGAAPKPESRKDDPSPRVEEEDDEEGLLDLDEIAMEGDDEYEGSSPEPESKAASVSSRSKSRESQVEYKSSTESELEDKESAVDAKSVDETLVAGLLDPKSIRITIKTCDIDDSDKIEEKDVSVVRAAPTKAKGVFGRAMALMTATGEQNGDSKKEAANPTENGEKHSSAQSASDTNASSSGFKGFKITGSAGKRKSHWSDSGSESDSDKQRKPSRTGPADRVASRSPKRRSKSKSPLKRSGRTGNRRSRSRDRTRKMRSGSRSRARRSRDRGRISKRSSSRSKRSSSRSRNRRSRSPRRRFSKSPVKKPRQSASSSKRRKKSSEDKTDKGTAGDSGKQETGRMTGASEPTTDAFSKSGTDVDASSASASKAEKKKKKHKKKNKKEKKPKKAKKHKEEESTTDAGDKDTCDTDATVTTTAGNTSSVVDAGALSVAETDVSLNSISSKRRQLFSLSLARTEKDLPVSQPVAKTHPDTYASPQESSDEESEPEPVRPPSPPRPVPKPVPKPVLPVGKPQPIPVLTRSVVITKSNDNDVRNDASSKRRDLAKPAAARPSSSTKSPKTKETADLAGIGSYLKKFGIDSSSMSKEALGAMDSVISQKTKALPRPPSPPPRSYSPVGIEMLDTLLDVSADTVSPKQRTPPKEKRPMVHEVVEVTSSTGDDKRKDKSKVSREEVEQIVKAALRPYYGRHEISKDEYKDIMKRTVSEVLAKSKSKKPNEEKITKFVDSCVEHAKKTQKKKAHAAEEKMSDTVKFAKAEIGLV